MSGNSLKNTQMREPYRVAITIPANTAVGATAESFADLIRKADKSAPIEAIRTVRVYEYAPASTTARAAFDVANARLTGTVGSGGRPLTVATDFTTHGQRIPAGVPYDFPAELDVAESYPRSTDGSTVSALVLIGF